MQPVVELFILWQSNPATVDLLGLPNDDAEIILAMRRQYNRAEAQEDE